MKMRVRAPVTPVVMRWCRETAKLSIPEAARKIHRPESEIEAWENGSLLPTMPQARNAAKAYKRPLAVFYLKDPPKEWQVLKDFRTLPARESRDFSYDLSYLIRETVDRQEWMREFLVDDGQESLTLVGSANTSSNVTELSNTIREKLEIKNEDFRKCKSSDAALKVWIKKVESIGVFVFRDSRISTLEARGFAISDDYAPFIFLNSNDSKYAQIFTLVHELVHLWINEPGISNLEAKGSALDSSSSEIEIFCNKVTGLVLLNPLLFDEKWATRNSGRTLEENIEKLARYFKVSREVVARRLLDDGIISNANYNKLRNQYRIEWLAYKEIEKKKLKQKKSRPSPYRTLFNRNGNSFSRVLLTAYNSGSVSGRDLSGLLNCKLNNLKKYADISGLFPGMHKSEESA